MALRHSRATYAYYQQLIAECDQEIDAAIRAFEPAASHTRAVDDCLRDEGTDAEPEAPTESPAKRFDLRGHLTLAASNRVAQALRWATQSLYRSPSSLQHFRRMRARLGTPQATTATAHTGADLLPSDHASRGLRRQHPRCRGASRLAAL